MWWVTRRTPPPRRGHPPGRRQHLVGVTATQPGRGLVQNQQVEPVAARRVPAVLARSRRRPGRRARASRPPRRSRSRPTATRATARSLARSAFQSIIPSRSRRALPMKQFSSTVASRQSARSWWTIPTRGAAGTSVWTAIPPSSGSTAPLMIFTIVDLPDPLWPSKAWTSPCRTSRLTSCRASVAPNRLWTPPTARHVERAEGTHRAHGVSDDADHQNSSRRTAS